MSGSYANESLDDRRDLLPEISAECTRLTADVKAASLPPIEEKERTPSPLQQWASSPLVETSGRDISMNSLMQRAGDFPLSEKLDEIVDTLKVYDVVLVVAPTGAGKSIQAPLLAEKLARGSESGKRFRKTLLAVPTVEHCGSTARTFGTLFNDSGITLSAFHNPYDERICVGDGDTQKLMKRRNGDGDFAEFVVSPYNGVIRVLPGASLNLLIVDECHEPNTNVQVVISMAVKMMNAELFDPKVGKSRRRTLNNLLLMTATMDKEERNNLESYFADAGCKFKILDYTHRLNRKNKLTMSCIDGSSSLPEMYVKLPLSTNISKALNAKAAKLRVSSPDKIELTARLETAMNCVMEEAALNLGMRMDRRQRNEEYDMQSIIIINTGQEQVDKMHTLARKSPNFKFEGREGFHLVRMTSLVKDDPSITSECDIDGKWQPAGKKGRIINTTNFVASGLTVPNAAYVIDCGQQKIPAMYTRNGLRSLETIDIDRQMMMQRAGRTGRTTDGVYILPYSVEKVDEMVNKSHGMLLRHRNFEERDFLLQKIHDLNLPHEPPHDLEGELKTSFVTRGLFTTAQGFDKDTLLMHSLMNFLSTENARIIIQGVRFGIAAHVVYLVADSLCKNVKFCQHGTFGRGRVGGPSVDKSAIHLYAEAMDAMEGNRRSRGHGMGNLGATDLPEKYKGCGDSIALADLLVSYHIVKDVDYPPESNFWGGKWREGRDGEEFAELKTIFVREEGEGAIHFYASQITRHLIGSGILPARKISDENIFDKQLNRHIVSTDNYCLNQDGRALLSALLTMHSSRVGKHRKQGRKQIPVYEIYCAQSDGQKESLHPEATYTQPERSSRDGKMYGRYAQIGKRSAKYAGTIDPISIKQLAFFININGKFNTNITDRWLKFDLNASPGRSGIMITATESSICKRVDEVREMLKDGLRLLTNTEDKDLIAGLEKFIIKLWRECEKVEDAPARSERARSSAVRPDLPNTPPPAYSRYANGSDDRPNTPLELKERDARRNGRY